MQVWLPVHVPGDPIASFRESVAVLTTRHLNAQANEAKVVLRAASGLTWDGEGLVAWPGRGWRTVALTRAWRPYPAHLARYGVEVCAEQTRRGFRAPHTGWFAAMARELPPCPVPAWFGGPVHALLRANLLAKDPHYRRFGWTEEPGIVRAWDDVC